MTIYVTIIYSSSDYSLYVFIHKLSARLINYKMSDNCISLSTFVTPAPYMLIFLLIRHLYMLNYKMSYNCIFLSTFIYIFENYFIHEDENIYNLCYSDNIF